MSGHGFVDIATGWRTPAARSGLHGAGHNLQCAYAIAALRRAGERAEMVVQRRLGRLSELAADIERRGFDDVVLWAPEPVPPQVGALEALLSVETRRVAAFEERLEASPWLDGVLPASAAEVGVKLDQPLERILAEIAWIDERVAQPVELPLHGAWRGDVLEAFSATHLIPLLTGDEPDAELLALYAAAGGRRVRIDALERLERWRDAGVPLLVELDLPPDASIEDRLVQAAEIAPDLTYTWRGTPPRRPRRLAVPELVRSSSFREEAALERGVLQRALRAHEGLYPDADGYAHGVLDLVWQRADDPSAHAAWLSDVLAPGGAILSETPSDHRALPVSEVSELERESETRRRLPSGEAFDIAPYTQAARLSPEVPTVLEVDDLDALLADADEAHRTGTLPAALESGLTRLQHAVAWTAPELDPVRRLPRLWVDDEGVRPAPGAAVIGAVGDPLEALLDAVRPGIDADVARAHAEHPWLVAFASAPFARRRVAEVLGPAAASALRISGLGGCLHYAGQAPVARQVLLLAGESHVLFDPATGRLARVTPDVAAIWEALACTQDPAAVAEWLAGERGLDPAQARTHVARLLARLGGGLRPPVTRAYAAVGAE